MKYSVVSLLPNPVCTPRCPLPPSPLSHMPNDPMTSTFSERSHLLKSNSKPPSRVTSDGGGEYSSVSLNESPGSMTQPQSRRHQQQIPLAPSHTSYGSHSTSSARWLSCLERVDAFFLITARKSSIAQEIRAGAVTFVTMVSNTKSFTCLLRFFLEFTISHRFFL